MTDYSNSHIEYIIDEYVHNEKHRKLLKRRYIDGVCYEPLSEEFSLTPRQVKNIVRKYENIIFSHL